MLIEILTMPKQERLTDTERLEHSFISEIEDRRQARRDYWDTFDPAERAEFQEKIDEHTAEIESILLEHLGNVALMNLEKSL